MKTLALLILFVGLYAFVSAEEDYDFELEDLDEEYEDKPGHRGKPKVSV